MKKIIEAMKEHKVQKLGKWKKEDLKWGDRRKELKIISEWKTPMTNALREKEGKKGKWI